MEYESFSIKCIAEGCDKIVRIADKYDELISESCKTFNEYACVGALEERIFLNGHYIGGDYGGKVIEVDISSDDASLILDEYIDSDVIEGVDGSLTVADFGPEVMDLRYNDLCDGKITGLVHHIQISGPDIGPRYCKTHAELLNYTCPECKRELKDSKSESYLSMDMLDEQEFMEMFLAGVLNLRE